LWIASSIRYWVDRFNHGRTFVTVSDVTHELDVLTLTALAGAVAAYLAIKVINATTARQQARAARIDAELGF
jgi:hypothetical protein